MAKHDVWKTIFIGIVALGLLVSAASIGEGWLAIGMIVNGVWLAGWAGILTVDEIRSRMIDHEDYRNGVTTRTEAVRKLAEAWSRTRLTPTLRRLFAGWLAWRRW